MNTPASPPSGPTGPSSFDKYASKYDEALAQGLSASGESKDFFAEGRVNWLVGELKELQVKPLRVLDFGCGTGTNSPYLLGINGVRSLQGVDVSEASLAAAHLAVPDERAVFSRLDRFQPQADCDLAFTNGVFHHIPPAERAEAVAYIFRALKPGGLLSFWENNPWNPGTRIVMKRIPFDRDAITLSAPAARRMLQAGGFELLRTEFLFIFPNVLRRLRRIEPSLARLPFGSQYQVLCRKPMAS